MADEDPERSMSFLRAFTLHVHGHGGRGSRFDPAFHVLIELDEIHCTWCGWWEFDPCIYATRIDNPQLHLPEMCNHCISWHWGIKQFEAARDAVEARGEEWEGRPYEPSQRTRAERLLSKWLPLLAAQSSLLAGFLISPYAP